MATPTTTYRIQPTRADLTEGSTGATVFTFTVTRSSGVGTGSVGYRLQHITTTQDDFVGATSGVVQFAAGEVSKTISVLVAGDVLVEGDELFGMVLTNPVGGVVQTEGAIGRIRNDDLPVMSIVATSATKAEGTGGTTPFTFTVTRSSGFGVSSVNWAVRHGTATAADFSGPLAGTVLFGHGETSKVITVNVVGDALAEGNETFSVLLTGATGARLGRNAAAGLIQNDDAATVPALSIAATSASKAEGNSGTTPFTFTVTRSSGAGASSAQWSVQHGTTAAADFSGATSGVVSFAAGETSKVITVNVVGDTAVEGDEAFTVQLSNAVNATLGTATAAALVQNDDALGTLSIAATSASKAEGDSGTTPFTFTVTRTGSSTVIASVDYAVVNGGTTAGDFSGFSSGTLVFAAGETSKVITINITGDLAVEADEAFTVQLSNAVNATLGTATAAALVQNDDALGTLSIAATSASKAEGDSGTTPFTFTVTRTGSSTVAASVDYAVVNGGTTAGDFSGASSGTLVFAAGETSKVITVNVVGDTAVEGDEAFTVQLSNAVNATLGTATAAALVQNDDALGTLSIAATSASKAEGDSGTTPFTFTVTRTGSSTVIASVDYAVVNGGTTAGDFSGASSGTLVFAAGETSKVITINITGDLAVEADEAFTVQLSNAVNATLGTATAAALVQNDDALGTLSIAATSASKAEGDSGTTPFTFTVTRTGSSTVAASVDYAVVNGGTTAGDFSGASSGTLVFAAGETSKVITINITGDLAVEADEAFTVQLSNAVNATLGTATAAALVQNDDALGTLSIAATSASKAEGNSGTTPFTFTVTRSNGVGASAVDYAVVNGGTTTADFSGATTGSVSFADGETSKVITVNVAGDTTAESNEGFSVVLSAPTNATIVSDTASGTIVDDDTSRYSIAATDANKAEGNAYTSPPTVFTFTVSRSLSTGTGSVSYSVQSGTATAGSDYYGTTSGSVSFAAGETSKTISVNVVGDLGVEADETFTVTLSNPSNGTIETAVATATIINDDLPGIDGSVAADTGFTLPANTSASIDNLVTDNKWGGALGTGVTLTYSFSTSTSVFRNPGVNEQTYEALNAAQRAAAIDAMNRLSAVCNITFVEVADTATSAGDIRWTRSTVAGLGSTSYAYMPTSLGVGGDIWIGPSSLYDNPTLGSGAFSVFMHELGHAMGLDHPHEGSPAPVAGEDQIKYSLMSYRAFDGAPTYGATGGYLPTSYMLNDISALQTVYGANAATNAGDNVYTWSSTAVVYECLWDTGGTDTISGASQAQACTINLNAGQWSTIGVGYDVDIFTAGNQLARDTLTIARNVTIENAVGSGFADTLLGNAAANVLTGGAGADTLTGGAGADTFRFVTSSEGGDQLTDFLSGTDVIEVVSSNFGGLPVGNATGFFVSGTVPVASGSGAFFLFDTDDRTLTFDSNGTLAGGTTLIVSLNSGAVTASDLRIVSA